MLLMNFTIESDIFLQISVIKNVRKLKLLNIPGILTSQNTNQCIFVVFII